MAVTDGSDHRSQLERDTHTLLGRLEQIDRILKGPIETLLHLAEPSAGTEGESPRRAQYQFPVWLTVGEPDSRIDNSLLTRGMCIYTLQSLSRKRRRFAWLEKNKLLSSRGVRHELARSFIPVHYDPEGDPGGERYFREALDVFRSKTFGTLNPLTAAQIFRTLTEAGEDLAHEGIGFLAFFAMIWPLYRRVPEPLALGARIEPSPPTAYVTSKCLIPIDSLRTACDVRARLLAKVAELVGRLAPPAAEEGFDTTSQTWTFSADAEELCNQLIRLSQVAIIPHQCQRAARRIGDSVDAINGASDAAAAYQLIVGEMTILTEKLCEETRVVLKEAQIVVNRLKSEVVARLETEDGLTLLALEDFRFAEALMGSEEYRADLWQAADKALSILQYAIDQLSAAIPKDEVGRSEKTPAELRKVLQGFADANVAIGAKMTEVLRLPAEWCRSVVDREVAYASARNYTNFDPAELVSSLLVASRLKLLSRLQVKEAAEKALHGQQEDGSWRLGYPYYSRDDEMGIRVPTADLVWTLARCIETQSMVTETDEALFLFVDWLERTRESLQLPSGKRYYGWKGDRMRHGTKIHVLTTTYAINALLEIRDLIEHRLWGLCEARFTTVKPEKSLWDVDPVDLGKVHRHRLHAILAGVVRGTGAPDTAPAPNGGASEDEDEPPADSTRRGTYLDAQYSLALHGPPGSSKTALITALASDMWQSSPKWGHRENRLIRITPADFTRLGEDRIDSEARLIFDLLGHVRQVTILFDEIDDLLARRNTQGTGTPSFMGLVVPAMLNRLQDLRDACRHQEICFVLATNYIDTVEPALIRRGRVDEAIPVVYPDFQSRLAIAGRAVHKAIEEAIGKECFCKAREDTPDLRTYLRERIEMMAAETAGRSWQECRDRCTGAAGTEAHRISIFLAGKAGLPRAEEHGWEDGAPLPDDPYQSRIESMLRCEQLRHEYIEFVICRYRGGRETGDEGLRKHARRELRRARKRKLRLKLETERALSTRARPGNDLPEVRSGSQAV